MPNLNKVMLMGNLTRDPEVKYSPKGTAVANLDIALNSSYKDSGGNKVEEVTYVNCTAFGKTAEQCGQYLAKGRSVFIEGRLKMDSWDDKATGQKRTKLGVVVENVQFLGGKQEGGGQQRPVSKAKGKESAPWDDGGEDDGVPF